jgi:hypothetical protein
VSDDLSIPNPGYRGNRAGRYGTGPSRVRPSIDPDTRRLVVFAAGLAVVLLALIGASTLLSHRSTEIPVVTADPRPIKVKPENPGGMKIDGAENDVFSGGSDTANARLAPPPENPDAKALRTTAAPPPAAPPDLSSAPMAPPPPAKPAASLPATSPATTAHPAPAKPPVQAGATENHAAAPDHSAADHPAMVQLAALASEEAARKEWELMEKRMPDLLSGRKPVFSRTERDGHTYWRVRTAGFADLAQARSFCDQVRTKGGGCSVAAF